MASQLPSTARHSFSGQIIPSTRVKPRRCARLTTPPVAFPINNGKVRLIATDVDGTLLNPQQQLTSRVERAVKTAAALGVPAIVATGKAYGPWAREVLPRMGGSLPGVFLQGLMVCGRNGEVLYCRSLEDELVLEVVEFAKEHGLTLTAYSGDRILCEATNPHTDRLLFYREPTPEGVGPLQGVVGSVQVQKLILMESQERICAIRPLAEGRFKGRVSFTTALPGMLEVLPLSASKGAGLAWLLNYLRVPPSAILAMGDGENDVEMLEMAGVSVAMGNAGPGARAAADFVVGPNSEDGVAQAIEQFVLEPRGIVLGKRAPMIAYG